MDPAANASSKYVNGSEEAATFTVHPLSTSTSASTSTSHTQCGTYQLQANQHIVRRLADKTRVHMDLSQFVPLSTKQEQCIDMPHLLQTVTWAGLDASSSWCWRTFTTIVYVVFTILYGSTYALAFYGFGTPPALAITLGINHAIGLVFHHHMWSMLLNSRYFWLFQHKQLDMDARLSLGSIVGSVAPFCLIVLMFWLGVVPMIQDPSRPRMFVMICIVVPSMLGVGFCCPNIHAQTIFMNAWLKHLSRSKIMQVDSYAHSLIAVFMDTKIKPQTRLEKVDVLYRNFINECSLLGGAKPVGVLRLIAFSQIGLVFGILLSCICVVLPVTGDETISEAIGRLSVGIGTTLYFVSFFLILLNSAVSASRRWQSVISVHLCNPKVTQRALEIGAWQTVGDYKAWLTDNHDLRQQICFVPVDLDSVGKIASLLGSGAAVVLGYGVLTLVGLR